MWSRYDYVMGKLSIIYRDVETQSERILWQVRSNQGNVWKYGSVTFDITSFQYKVKNVGYCLYNTAIFITVSVVSVYSYSFCIAPKSGNILWHIESNFFFHHSSDYHCLTKEVLSVCCRICPLLRAIISSVVPPDCYFCALV